MKRMEIIGALLVALVLVAMPVGVFAYQLSGHADQGCKVIVMRTYENGNPMPPETRVKKGEKVCLRITSYDVTHGFVISDLGIDAGEIHAGKWSKIEFVPTEAGTFNYVCSIRCSPMHSRVRGQIIVEE
ncbi:MAG: cupredoxin domain-containing protein [Chloroflexota bacterium]